MKKILAFLAVFLMGAAFGLILVSGQLNAQSAGDADVLSKLNDIAKSQEDVMAGINAIKEDLKIIKIRITQMQ
jgi:hypothetical protein